MSHTKFFRDSIQQAWVLDTEIQNPRKPAEAGLHQIWVFICPRGSAGRQRRLERGVS